jgi:hypothetical protein
MILHKEGDASKAMCEHCKAIVPVTFRYANFNAQGLVIPDILQGFCDRCGDSVSLPHQSTFKIREYRETHDNSISVRIPKHYNDILTSIGGVHKISRKPNLICRLLSELYIGKMVRPGGTKFRRKVFAALDDDFAKGKSDDRLCCSFSDITFSNLKIISAEENKKESVIVKGIIVAAKHDLLENGNPALNREFEELAVARL